MSVATWLSTYEREYKSIIKASENLETPNETEKLRRIQIFVQMDDDIERCKIKDPIVVSHLSLISALVNYELGKIHFWTHPDIAETYLENAWHKVEEHRMDPDYILLAVCILNELNAMVIRNKNSDEKSKKYFKLIQEVWIEYKCATQPYIMTLEDLFLCKSHRENLRLSTTFDPVYNLHRVFKQSFSYSLATYLLFAVKEISEDDHEPFVWSRTVFRLADMFITSQRFSSARHILSYASVLVIQDEVTLRRKGGKNYGEMVKMCEYVKAALSYYWGSYVMLLLSVSRNIKKRKETEFAPSSCSLSMTILNEHKDKTSRFEGKISCYIATNGEEAIEILRFGKTHLEGTRTYYLQRQRIEEYMAITENITSLYENVLYFHTDNVRLCEIHELFVKSMEGKLGHFHPKTHSTLVQRMLFQLTYWYSRFLCLKSSNCSKKKYTEEEREEMITLCHKLITYSLTLLRYFTKDHLNDSYSDDSACYALHACVCLNNAYMFRFILTHDLDDLKKGKEYKTNLLSYVKRNPQQTKFVGYLVLLRDDEDDAADFCGVCRSSP